MSNQTGPTRADHVAGQSLSEWEASARQFRSEISLSHDLDSAACIVVQAQKKGLRKEELRYLLMQCPKDCIDVMRMAEGLADVSYMVKPAAKRPAQCHHDYSSGRRNASRATGPRVPGESGLLSLLRNVTQDTASRQLLNNVEQLVQIEWFGHERLHIVLFQSLAGYVVSGRRHNDGNV